MGKLTEIHPVDLHDPEQIQEFVDHSWYKYADESKGLHPFDGVTDPDFVLGKNTVGTRTAIDAVDEAAKYSWVKSPRWRGHPMETGPLARYVIGYAMGKPEFKEPVDKLLKTLDVPLTAVFSTLGRTAARGLEASWAAHKMRYFFDKLMANLKAGNFATANVDKWEPETWPTGAAWRQRSCRGLGPWIKSKDGRIENYSASCRRPGRSPRDSKTDRRYEAALMNNKRPSRRAAEICARSTASTRAACAPCDVARRRQTHGHGALTAGLLMQHGSTVCRLAVVPRTTRRRSAPAPRQPFGYVWELRCAMARVTVASMVSGLTGYLIGARWPRSVARPATFHVRLHPFRPLCGGLLFALFFVLGDLGLRRQPVWREIFVVTGGCSSAAGGALYQQVRYTCS